MWRLGTEEAHQLSALCLLNLTCGTAALGEIKNIASEL